MSNSRHGKSRGFKRILRNCKRRIANRLRERVWSAQDAPMLRAGSIQYQLSDRVRGLGAGGIGALHLLARQTGLIEAIDRSLHLLKVHLPYHESDHVLNIAYNALCGGTCLEDLELRRSDEAYLDALGAQRIPDPTTAGDFCRRFSVRDIEALQDAINTARVDVWQQQPAAFFDQAVLDVDGTLAETLGECKQGMGLAYDGTWGYHPLLVSLANTQEPLYLSNRSGNRPSHEGAAGYLDRAIDLCRAAKFRRIRLRGDTDFSQTAHLDRWDAAGDVSFVFGIDAMRNRIERANELPESAWKTLERPAKYEVQTEPRARPENVKERIVVEKGYKNIRLLGEQVAEFAYCPTACAREYRVIVVRKKLSVERGQEVLFEDYRYFFYITNDRTASPAELVFEANGRCNQENLIAQLKGGVQALAMPVDSLVSNWAYMVMASLAWSLKAWFALRLPEPGMRGSGVRPAGANPGATARWSERRRDEKRRVLTMEFKRFVNAFIRVPCQIVRSGRRILYRLLAWNPWQEVFARGLTALGRPLRC